tara:strand:- start:154 stop:498 length:345 start_codon:yes stop_codon:yes gene_type:complete
MHDAEWSQVVDAAGINGASASAWCRQVLLDAAAVASPPAAFSVRLGDAATTWQHAALTMLAQLPHAHGLAPLRQLMSGHTVVLWGDAFHSTLELAATLAGYTQHTLEVAEIIEE